MRVLNMKNIIKAGCDKIEKKYRSYFNDAWVNLPIRASRLNVENICEKVIILNQWAVEPDVFSTEIERAFRDVKNKIINDLKKINPVASLTSPVVFWGSSIGKMLVPSTTENVYEVRVFACVYSK